MKLKITHSGTSKGEKLYSVTDGFDCMFTGHLEEVKRFILIHNAKVQRREAEAAAVVASLRAG